MLAFGKCSGHMPGDIISIIYSHTGRPAKIYIYTSTLYWHQIQSRGPSRDGWIEKMCVKLPANYSLIDRKVDHIYQPQDVTQGQFLSEV